MDSMSTLLLFSLLAADPQPQAVTYDGQLSQLERGQPAVVVKEFSARTLLQYQDGNQWQASTLISETAAPLPWSEQLTHQSSAAPAMQSTAIGYRHEERMHVISGLFPLLWSPEPLVAGLTWETDGGTFEVASATSLDGVECWLVNVVTGPARRHQIWVRQDQPIVEMLKQTVFMGQGDRFELSARRTGSVTLTPEVATAEQLVLQRMQALQVSLKRDPQDRQALLTDEQVALAAEQLPSVIAAARTTALDTFLTHVARELEERQSRTDKVTELAAKFVGQPAPPFTLTQQRGGDVSSADLRGKVVILHFWNYEEEPLEQPYGQVGYLDFLAMRYKDRPLAVYGVAVQPELAVASTRDSAIRSIKRLSAFMKIGYEVTLDTRSALNQFGNPTRLGAELPLWIVLDANGQVVHYHSGYYTIDNAKGLQQLDEIVAGLLPE